MASNYGRNFGFRRSDESVRVSEGRLRTPATGTFRIGMLVAFDPAAPGYLKAAAANQVGDGATVGLLLQEEQFIGSIYGQGVEHYDSNNLGLAKNNTLSVITSGAGTKVWFQNTGAETRADGRVLSAVTMFTPGTLAILDYLAWDGTKFVEGTDETDSMLRVTAVDLTAGYCEAVLIR
jgi:hypothetical protein